MHIEEIERYKVACYVTRVDLKQHGITIEDLVDRTPLGQMFIKKAVELSKGCTEYEWPHCAYSMQMEFYPQEIALIFSERVDDYIYNLRQTAMVLSGEQAAQFQHLVDVICVSEEEEARELIRSFEENMRQIQQ